MPHPRTILHADMDAFYASIEQRDHPELRGRPVIVGGRGDRGVVSAASYEARRFGVHSAMPGALARRLCPDAVFLRGDMTRYQQESKRIFEIFRRFAPSVEGLSLDEAFLELTGSERLLGPAIEVGERLRREVREGTGLAVSVGIAPVKMVAKIASDLAKPDGLLQVPRESLRSFLDPLPAALIWGVGPVGQARLSAVGIETLGDLARAEPDFLRERLGDWGVAMARLARGEDVREVEAYREAVSISEENTFAEDVADAATLKRTIRSHAEAVARRLRCSQLEARTVVLKLKLGRRVAPGPRGYPLITRRTTLGSPTDDGCEIARVARRQLLRASLEEPIRLLGVGVTNLAPAAGRQLELFGASGSRERQRRLNRVLDEIHERFGPRSIVRGEDRGVERAGLSFQIKTGD